MERGEERRDASAFSVCISTPIKISQYILVFVKLNVYIYSMKTNCSKCSNPLESNRVGKQRYCLSCHNEYMRRTRPKHSELSDEQRIKANARSYLNEYVRRGKVIKQPCSMCGDDIAEAHHPDYNKPLEIVWLCRRCHLIHHKHS